MDMKLSSDKEHFVLDNLGLVHYLVQKLGVTPNLSEYEDIVSIGIIGLIKAAITFDASKKFAFATYASRCINNEIFMHYRKANKYANDISLDEPIGDDGKGNELKLGDTINDPNSDFVENIVNKEDFINLISIILNCLYGKYKLALLYLIGNTLQREIGEKLDVSQSYVSRLQAKAIKKVQKIANSQQLHYTEVFSMLLLGNEYRISFSSKDIRKFNKIFATFLQKLTSIEKLPDFKVNCNRERIVIQVPAIPESFSFIAQIIQEIDEFSMSFVSNKPLVSNDDTGIQRVETDAEHLTQETNDTNAVESFEDQTSEEIRLISTGVSTVDKTISDSTVGKGSKVKQVKDYMLSMDSFTVKDLKNHFPNFTACTINNALTLAKRKSLITAISRGKYVVLKT